jgi:uncharacterized membrane protein
MGLIAQLASLFGIETETLLQRIKESAVAYAAIGLFALICIVFLLVAVYTWLVGWVGPIWAPLIIAAAALVIAVVFFIALRIQEAALKRRAEERRKEAETTALLASAALGALPDLLNSSLVRNVGLPLALYAGFLLFSGSRKSSPDAED